MKHTSNDTRFVKTRTGNCYTVKQRESSVNQNPPTSMRVLFHVVTNFQLLRLHAFVAGSTLSGTLCI